MVKTKGAVIVKKSFAGYASLRKKSFGIRDLGKLDESAARQLHYWMDEMIVKGQNIKGWKKFDFYTFLWILIVRELKALGIDNSVLVKCSKALFDTKNQSNNELANAVLYCLNERKGVLFLLSKTGDYKFIYDPNDVSKPADGYRYKIFVGLDITWILILFLRSKDFYSYIKENQLLKEREIQVLNILHEHTNAMVSVKFLKEQVTITDTTDSIEEFLNLVLHQGNYKTIDIQI